MRWRYARCRALERAAQGEEDADEGAEGEEADVVGDTGEERESRVWKGGT